MCEVDRVPVRIGEGQLHALGERKGAERVTMET